MISLPELAAKRGWKCEICQKTTRALQRNHVFHKRSKGHPEFDVEENLQLVCADCHEKRAHNYENKVVFWAVQLTRYPDLREWYAGLGLRHREFFE